MVVARMQAGRKGVQPLQPVRQTVFHQEFQRAIGHGRLAAKAFGGQTVQHLVCAHGPVRFQQDFQGAPPHRGQPGTVFCQPVAGLVKRACLAGAVVVWGKGLGLTVGQYRYFITFLVDLLSRNMKKRGPATSPKGDTMRMMLSALALAAAGPVLAEPPRIAVDTPITASLVRQVAGDLAQVQVLLPQGASAHHHQMRPSEARGLQDAGLLIWTGPELTPWLERAASSVAADVAQLQLLDVPGTHLRGYAGDAGQDHGHDHDHAEDDADTDPHAWLDPDNAQTWLAAIAETLGRADPGNAANYARNAAAAAGQVRELDAQLQARLSAHADARIVVFHDAYGYFTDHYGLRPAIAVSLGDASSPSAARLSRIRDQIAETGAACAFPEYASDPTLVQTVIQGTDVRMGAELSPEGGMLEAGPDLYPATMTAMAETLVACLNG